MHNKGFNISKNIKYGGYQKGLASIACKFFSETAGGAVKNENMLNKKLAEELHKPILRTFWKQKVYSTFIDIIWGADLANMESVSKFNKGIHFLLCIIDIFIKYAWVIRLADKKSITITIVFQKNLY